MPHPPQTAAWNGFLYGAASVGDMAGARLPAAGPIRPSRGFAADAAKLGGDAGRLVGDGRRAVGGLTPADAPPRVAAGA